MTDKERNIFLEKLEYALDHNILIKLILSNKIIKSSELNRITVIPAKIKENIKYSFTFSYATKDTKKNYNADEVAIQINKHIEKNFRNIDLFTLEENIQLLKNKKGTKSILKISEPTFKTLPNFNHDRIKKKRISVENNIYLKELGITSKDEKINKNMHDKFRQINKYLEIVESLLHKLKQKKSLKIVDMGSGKGYLTFALYDFLKNNMHLDPHITGIEFRKELVDKSNQIASKCNFDNLNFIQGEISGFKQDVDVLIALHACDTATDDAIFKGVTLNAKLIIVAPCCQKQIRKEINVTNELSSILKFGILKERHSVLITDGIRALIIEAFGYKTKVFEFISTEHTAKNIMITGELSSKKVNKKQILDSIKGIKNIFGIKQHYLETLLKIN